MPQVIHYNPNYVILKIGEEFIYQFVKEVNIPYTIRINKSINDIYWDYVNNSPKKNLKEIKELIMHKDFDINVTYLNPLIDLFFSPSNTFTYYSIIKVLLEHPKCNINNKNYVNKSAFDVLLEKIDYSHPYFNKILYKYLTHPTFNIYINTNLIHSLVNMCLEGGSFNPLISVLNTISFIPQLDSILTELKKPHYIKKSLISKKYSETTPANRYSKLMKLLEEKRDKQIPINPIFFEQDFNKIFK